MIQRKSIIPIGHRENQLKKRQNIIQNLVGESLSSREIHSPEDLKGVIENQVDYMRIPLAIASPLVINGNHAQGEFTVPVCTIEGALVASMTRGMLATSFHGIETIHLKQEISRSPIFIFENLKEIKSFLQWIEIQEKILKEKAEETTRYGRLLRIDKYCLNKYVILDFIYHTGNAAGQNMVSLATERACQYIQRKKKVKYQLESNFSGDKKFSQLNMVRGRGHSVTAETFISNKILKKVLNTLPDDYNFQEKIGPRTSQMCNSSGTQFNLSNALASIYLATGQDIACIAENSIGYTAMEKKSDGVLFHLTMPSITVGTIGGGTRLNDVRYNLKLLNCHDGENSSKKLAEIICASALCLEISLWSAIATEDWVKSHLKHGRLKK